MADDNNNSPGDGLLASQGSQEFNDVIGTPAVSETGGGGTTQTTEQQGGNTQQQQAATTQQTTNPIQQTTPAQTGQTTQAVQTGAQQTAAAAAPQQPDLSAIIRATVEATTAAQQQNRPAAATTNELTDAQFRQKYGIQNVTEEMVAALVGQDPKRAAAVLEAIQQNAMTSALRMSNDIMEAKLQQMQSRFEPHVKSWTAYQAQQQNVALDTEFYKAYPDLANDKEIVSEILDSYYAKVQTGKIKFNNTNEAFSAVGNSARAIITKYRGAAPGGGASTQTANGGGPANGGQSQQGGRQVQQSSRTMASTVSAGRQGTGSTTVAPKLDVDEVFGADAR